MNLSQAQVDKSYCEKIIRTYHQKYSELELGEDIIFQEKLKEAKELLEEVKIQFPELFI